MMGIWSRMKNVNGNSNEVAPVTMSSISYSTRSTTEKDSSVYEPIPSDQEVQESISYLKMLLKSFAHSKLGEEILLCFSSDTTSLVMKMILGAVKDKNVWHAFRNSEPVVQFMADISNKIPCFLPTLGITQSVASNIQAGGNGSFELEKYRIFKLILDKAKEMVLVAVIKAFAGMEKVFFSHEQQPGKKTKKRCCDLKHHPEEKSTSESAFGTNHHIKEEHFLATLLINATVLLCRIIREMLKYRSVI